MNPTPRPACHAKGLPEDRRRVLAQLTGGAAGLAVADPLASDRRCRMERRSGSLYTVMYGAFRPRRRNARRGDDPSALTDWYDSLLLLPVLGILMLSMTDGMLTLNLLAAGGRELNIVMAWLIESDPTLFAAVKMGLTSAGVVVLAVCARLRLLGRWRVGHMLYLFLCSYLALIGYELFLIAQII